MLYSGLARNKGRTVSQCITHASENNILAGTAFKLITLPLGHRDAKGHMMGRAELCLPEC